MSRFLALAGAIRRGRARDGLPYKLTLILTRRCPTRCGFCSIWKTPSPDEMTAEEWERTFASAPGTVWANLSGGEIFQRPDLPLILDALTARMPSLWLVDFPTTGWFPERALDACERLVRAGVRKVLVTVSLDGPPEVHDRLRGREGAHARACAAMRMLRDARIPRVRAFFGHTLFPENLDRTGETVEAAIERVPGLRPGDFHFNVGMESGHYYNNLGAGVKPERGAFDAVRRFERKGFSPVHLLERAYQRRIPRYLETGRSAAPCAALKASVFVDPQGVVYPCSIYSRPLGALRDHGYRLGSVLGLTEARDARRAVVEDRCPGCWTPCEAYQSLLDSWARPLQSGRTSGTTAPVTSQVSSAIGPPTRR